MGGNNRISIIENMRGTGTEIDTIITITVGTEIEIETEIGTTRIRMIATGVGGTETGVDIIETETGAGEEVGVERGMMIGTGIEARIDGDRIVVAVAVGLGIERGIDTETEIEIEIEIDQEIWMAEKINLRRILQCRFL